MNLYKFIYLRVSDWYRGIGENSGNGMLAVGVLTILQWCTVFSFVWWGFWFTGRPLDFSKYLIILSCLIPYAINHYLFYDKDEAIRKQMNLLSAEAKRNYLILSVLHLLFPLVSMVLLGGVL